MLTSTFSQLSSSVGFGHSPQGERSTEQRGGVPRQKPRELLALLGLAYDVCCVFSHTYLPKYRDTVIYIYYGREKMLGKLNCLTRNAGCFSFICFLGKIGLSLKGAGEQRPMKSSSLFCL